MAKTEDLRSENRSVIREILYADKETTLAKLKEKTGLSHGLIVTALNEMIDSGEICSRKTGSGVGRKTHLYSLNADHMHICGIFVTQKEDSYTFRMMEMDLYGRVCQSTETESDTYAEEPFCAALSQFLKNCCYIQIVITASPGMCADGIASNPGRYENDIGTWVRSRWNLPCILENDVNTAAIGFLQDVPDVSHLAFVYQPSAMRFGCGIIIGGRLYNGFSHSAGELRWLPFMDDASKYTAKELLALQIQSITSVLDPEVIGWYSRAVTPSEAMFPLPMPNAHKPRIIAAEDLERLVIQGIHSIAIDTIIHTLKG